MAEITLTAAPVLGADLSLGENRIVERADLALISVATPLGGSVTEALSAAWNLPMPEPTRSTAAGDMRAVQTGADQMLLVFPFADQGAEAHVQNALSGAGYTTEQTGAWVVLEVSGPQTMAALARLCPLDLDASVFPEGAAARTVMEHMGAVIIRLGTDRFWLLSASSSAASFLHAVELSYRNVM